jgi:autotransporter-associated beta strand protein
MTPLSNLYSVISTWNLDANGNWNVSGNWTPATFPNAIGDTANFLNVITANRIITLGQNITIGNINFDNSNNYTISGSTLIFSNAGTANLNVTNSNGNGLHSITSAVTLNSSLLMTHSSSSNFTFSGAIGGVGAFTKEGIGTLVFDGPTANTYTGLTTINNGTLLLNKTTGINAIVGSTLINTGGTLLLGTANQIVNTGLVTISGGTFNLGGNAETIGSLVFNSGTLTQGGATLTLTNTAATALTMGNNTTIAGPITFTSTGGVTYNGTTTRASIAGNLAMGPSATAHTFNINNGTDSIDLDISSVISGTAGITKTGTGVLQLSGTSPNTYTALTTISAGELILNKTSGINALAGSVTVNNGGTLTLGAAEQIINTSIATFAPGSTFNMGGFNETIGALIFTGGTYNHGGGVLTLTSNGTALSMGNGVTITGNIALTGTGTVTYTGTTATATMSGNLDLGTGIHTFSAANGTASTDVIFSGIISGSGAITMLASSPLSRFEFSGASPNTHTGLFTLSRGTLFLNKPSGIAIAGNFRINDNDGTVILGAPNQFADTSTFTHSSGTFIMNGFNETIGTYTFSSGTLNQGGATLSFNDPTTALTMRNTTINGNIAILNGGSVNFNPASGGTATISGNIDLGSITPQFNILNGPLATDMLISGTISSSGAGLNSIGPGVLQFSGGVANTYTGLTTISAGMLLLNKTPGINALPGNALINGGILALGGADQILDTASITLDSGEFNMSGFNETIGTLIFNGGVFNHGGGTISLTNPISALTMRDTTITGNVNLTGGGSILFDSTNNGTATISGNIDLGSFATNFNISDGSSATDMLISGIISGAGAGLNKTGLGLLEFSGSASNTYTGLTTISAGTLLLNKISGLNALPENALINGGILALGGADQILDTATVTLDSGEFNMSGFNETIGTLIYNGGAFNQGGGTVSLASPINALTMRNTTITGNMNLTSGGSVIFDSANNGTATISGNIDLGSFTTNFNISDGSSPVDMLISGSIANGGVDKMGEGTLVLTGSNTYSGGTLISTGTLQGNSISLQNNITNNANLIFDQTFDGTYADMISGTGNFLKQGSGNLILSNINTVGGSAIISNGTLTVNGTFEGGGPLILDSGATLRGTGTIVKDTTIRGTLATGDGLGALNFVGDQILDSGSTLEIEFNATSHDSFDIMGSLNIQPNSTLKLLPQMDIYPDSFSYNIVQTTTGISGSFTTVTSTLPMFIATVTYTPLNIILLKVALIPFSTFFPDGNAGAVAECLDSTTPTSSPDFSFIISQLRALPTIESIKDALLQMQPSAFTALAVAQENNTLNLKNAIYNHLKKQTESCAFLDTGGGLNFWISPFVTRTLLGNKNEEPGFSANSPGVIGGMDFLSPQGYFFGVSVGYNQTKLHWSQHRGKAGIHSTHVSLYGLWESYFGYLQGILMGESVSYSTVRNIEFGSLIDRKAKGHHGGKSGSLHLKGALKYNYEGVVFSPFVAGDYLFLHENGFREKGAGSLNLKVKNKNSDLLSSQIGVDVSSCYRYKQVSLAPFIQLSAIRESRFIGNHEKAKFNDCPLEVKGLYPSKTLGEVLVGVNTSFPKNSSLTLLFQGKYSEGYRNESLQLQYQHTF